MILPDFILPSRVNQCWTESGIDSLKDCYNKKHFKSYPHPIEYSYNSRGYRDDEWPIDLTELQNSVWCIGDSFTVGIGSPLKHTWTRILQQRTDQQVINVSMDGASNNWIARKAVEVLQRIKPKIIILHWSYTHRREYTVQEIVTARWKTYYNDIQDTTWPNCPPTPDQIDLLPGFIQDEMLKLHGHKWIRPISDEDLRMHHGNTTIDDDITNFYQCIRSVDSAATTTKIIHSIIPGFHPTLLDTKQFSINSVIPEFKIIDFARDHHHYDVKTATVFVNNIIDLL
jgi:hypothetical protein